MSDGLSWIEDEAADERTAVAPRWRRWLVLAIGASLWALLAVAVLRGSTPAERAPGGSTASRSGGAELAAEPTATPSPAPTPVAPRRGSEGAAVGVVTSGARASAAGPGDAATVAAAVARAWLGGRGPRLEVPGISTAGDGYVEHLAVEAIDVPAPGAAVVTLLAIVLPVTDDGDYGSGRVVRCAVPLVVDGPAVRPGGDPWLLPPPDLTPAPLAGSSIDDEALGAEAGEALAAAGYEDVAIAEVRRTEGWPLIVRLTGRAPGAQEPAEHVVWLRRHLDRLILAGERPPTEAVAP